jgi:hypothetical protein
MNFSYHDERVIVNTRIFVYSYMLLPACITGLILNLFTIVVLMNPKMRSSTNVYLTALSAANMICLINFILLNSVRYIISSENFLKQAGVHIDPKEDDPHRYESFINFTLAYWHPIVSTFQLYAIYLTCAVSVDRCLCLVFPFKVDKICSIKNAIVSIALIFVFCVVYNIPNWFEVESYPAVNSFNRTHYKAKQTNFARNEYMIKIRKYDYIIFV